MIRFANIWRNFFFYCAFICASSLSFAIHAAENTLTAAVSLVSMAAEASSESGGDEVYLDVTIATQDDAERIRLPGDPLAWSTEALGDISNVLLWQDELTDGEQASLLIALMERDMPPWNVDDLVGTVRIQLVNKAGELSYSIEASGQTEEKDVVTQKSPESVLVDLFGSNSHYKMVLLFSTD